MQLSDTFSLVSWVLLDIQISDLRKCKCLGTLGSHSHGKNWMDYVATASLEKSMSSLACLTIFCCLIPGCLYSFTLSCLVLKGVKFATPLSNERLVSCSLAVNIVSHNRYLQLQGPHASIKAALNEHSMKLSRNSSSQTHLAQYYPSS